ncbi:MAG: methyl-accepting chemotaxis protein [Candidatus Weimeria sp.]
MVQNKKQKKEKSHKPKLKAKLQRRRVKASAGKTVKASAGKKVKASAGKKVKAARISKKSIRTKLLLLTIPVTIVIVLALVSASALMSKKRLQEKSEAQLDSSIVNQKDNIESWLDKNLEFFQTAKHTIEMEKPETRDEMTKLLNIYYGQNDNCPNGLYVADAEGNYYKAEKADFSSRDVTSTIWYQQGLTRVNMDYGTAYQDVNDKYVVSASGILNDGSGVLKVISADVPLDQISIIVNSGIKMKGATSFLFDSDTGTIISSPDSSLVGTKITKSKDSFLRKIEKRAETDDYTETQIDDQLVEMKSISDTGWILVSYVPMSQIMKDVNSLMIVLLILGVLAVAVLAIVITVVITKIFAPITGITQSISDMSNGDFTIQLKKTGDDEIGAISGSISTFIESMRSMLSSIREESAKIRSQSVNSDKVSKDMYEESSSQTMEMERLDQIVDSLSQSVNQIAESATTLAQVVSDTKGDSNETQESMKKTVDIAHQGREDIRGLGDAMDAIRNSNKDLLESIEQVGQASNNITKIVNVITEIADETNLLSLNASIEAARAGESGRGFAVVASQIGNLANNSADSAADISKLIKKVSELINDVVKKADESYSIIEKNGSLIESSVKSFDDIYENIRESDERLSRVVENISKVEDVATNVAAISEEQAASTSEIQKTSKEIVEHARTLNQSSQDVAENSKELSDTSNALAGYVSHFRI